MKRYIIVTLALITAVVALMHPDVSTALMLFLFLSIIPGTNITVPYWILLPVYLLIVLVLIMWLSRQPLYIGSHAAQEQTAREIARKKIVPVKSKIKKRTSKRRLATVKN